MAVAQPCPNGWGYEENVNRSIEYSFALWLVEDSENFVCFRLHFLAIKTDRPNQFGIIALEVDFYSVDQRCPATSVISRRSSHMLSKLALTVDYCQSSIRKLQRERGTMNLEGPADRSVVVDSNVVVTVLLILSINDRHLQLLGGGGTNAQQNKCNRPFHVVLLSPFDSANPLLVS
jgi:hypothetical protein